MQALLFCEGGVDLGELLFDLGDSGEGFLVCRNGHSLWSGLGLRGDCDLGLCDIVLCGVPARNLLADEVVALAMRRSDPYWAASVVAEGQAQVLEVAIHAAGLVCGARLDTDDRTELEARLHVMGMLRKVR